MTTYRAPQGLLTDEGFFALRMVYVPGYPHGGVVGVHTLLEFGPAARFYFDGATSTFVLEVDGETIASDPVEFEVGAELTLDVEHTAERQRVRVRGADDGNCRIDGPPRRATDIASMVYVLGTKADGAEQPSVLVALRPINAQTFAELVEARMLSQLDAGGAYRVLANTLVARKARIYDTALAMRDAYDLGFGAGTQLDVIGAIIGLPRFGFEDERYRVFLGIQVDLILARAREEAEWTGTAPNLLKIARQFAGPDVPAIRYVSHPPKCYTLTIEDLEYSEAFLLARFMRTATWSEVLGLIQIELGEGNNLVGSASVTVPRAGLVGSASVTVTGAMICGTAVEVM